MACGLDGSHARDGKPAGCVVVVAPDARPTHQSVYRAPVPNPAVIEAVQKVTATSTGLTRIMREGAVEGKTQEPPCGTNVVQTTF